jgi:hypothetical protein
MPTPAFPHDHTADMRARRIQIDGVDYPYQDQLVWPGVATAPGLPATVAPIDRSDTGLPVGVQIIGPYLEDRTTIAFADLIEREFRHHLAILVQPGIGTGRGSNTSGDRRALLQRSAVGSFGSSEDARLSRACESAPRTDRCKS